MMAAKEIPEEYQEAATQRDKVLNNKVVDTSGNPVTLSEWENSLSRTSQGGIKTNSRVNAAAYIEHLKELKGVIAFDEFSDQIVKLRDVKKLSLKAGPLTGVDIPIIGYQIEKEFSSNPVFQSSYLQDAATIIAIKNTFNPVKRWIESEPWDGNKRAKNLFIDFLGVDETEENLSYTREVTRLFLLGLITRVYEPGAKVDSIPVIQGPQGIGKSTILRRLCPSDDTFNDSLIAMGHSKEDYEQIQGSLIVEISELSAMKRTEIDRVKGFITSQTDTYRDPYAKKATAHPRKCVFVGTTNQEAYLRDKTGERRFLPIQVNGNASKDLFKTDRSYFQQVLAEAKTWYDNKDSMKLNVAAEKTANKKREAAKTEDLDQDKIDDFLELKVPANWDNFSLYEKQNFFMHRYDEQYISSVKDKVSNQPMTPIKEFTTTEALRIIFGIRQDRQMNNSDKAAQIKISATVRASENWEYSKHVHRAKGSSGKRGYRRKE